MTESIVNMFESGKGVNYIINVLTNPDVTQQLTSKINEVKEKESTLKTIMRSYQNDEGAFKSSEAFNEYQKQKKVYDESINRLKSEISELEKSVYSLEPKCNNVTLELLDDIDSNLFGLSNTMASSNRIVSSNESYYDNTNIHGNVRRYSAGLASISLRDKAKSNYENAYSKYIRLNGIRDRLQDLKNNCNVSKTDSLDLSIVGASALPLLAVGLLLYSGKGMK